MGRTLETYRVILESEQTFWFKKTKNCYLYDILAKEVLESAQKFADAVTYWRNGLVKEKFLFSILFSQYKELINLGQRKSV